MTVKQAQIRSAQDMLNRHHKQALSPNQCGSTHVQPIGAPISVVWPIVRRFDRPQDYKRFVSTCSLLAGAGGVGSIRQVHVISGLPAATSIERLDDLDDERHIVRFTIVGGDHRLANYQSTLTLHECDGRTVAIESYVVDVPQGSTEEDTILFTDTIVKCNLRSLARISEKMAQSN